MDQSPSNTPLTPRAVGGDRDMEKDLEGRVVVAGPGRVYGKDWVFDEAGGYGSRAHW